MSRWTVTPLDEAHFADLERLFGARGACGGCWCMFPRRTRSEWTRHKGDGNRQALLALTRAGAEPGILGYLDGEPVAWGSLGPRAEFGVLARSRVLAPVDDAECWSIVCLFVRRDLRRTGLSGRMIEAAAQHARARGARLIEGYPVDARGPSADAFVWTGLLSAYLRAGFREVARRSPTRPIVRRVLRPNAAAAARGHRSRGRGT